MTKTESDKLWQADKKRNGWVLPQPAAWPLRLWGIRNVRAFVLAVRADRHARQWKAMGIGFGGIQQYDLWVIYAIAHGWC